MTRKRAHSNIKRRMMFEDIAITIVILTLFVLLLYSIDNLFELEIYIWLTH